MRNSILNLVKVLLFSALLSICINRFITSDWFLFSFSLCLLVHVTVYQLRAIIDEHIRNRESIKLAVRELEKERQENK